MASSRSEIRVGQVTTISGITKFAACGGRVPASKRWNLNLLINNSTAGALTFSAGVVHRYPDYGDGAEVSKTTAGYAGDVHPNERWLALHAGGDSLYLCRITPPSVMALVQTVVTGLGTITKVEFSPDGNWIAVAGTSSPYLKVYAFSDIYGAGLAVSNPASLPNGVIASVTWHPAGTFIVCSYSASAVLSGWPWSPGFGTKISDSSAGATAARERVLRFRPQGDVILCGFTATPWQAAWPFTGTFGTKYSDSAGGPSAALLDLAWAPGGGAYAFITNGVRDIYFQLWSAGFSGSKIYATQFAGTATSGAMYAPDDYSFYALGYQNQPAGYWIGFEWNPLGTVGRVFTGGGTTTPSQAPQNISIGMAQQGGIVFYTDGAGAIITKSIIGTPAASGGVGLLCNAMTVAANSTAKISGHVMNEGERLVVSGSGALNVMASAVEVTL